MPRVGNVQMFSPEMHPGPTILGQAQDLVRKIFGKRKCLIRGGEKERSRKRRKIFGPRRRNRTESEKE